VTLAGFVLVPFGLFGKTAFLAERVLGGVAATGVKVLVLAVIVGIGSTLFETFRQQAGGEAPTLVDVATMVLASLVLLGLSIFSPSVASGLLSGAPQLGAGAAVGTGLVVGGLAMAGAGAASLAFGASASGAAAAGAGGSGLGGGPAGGAPTGGPPTPPPAGPSSGGAASPSPMATKATASEPDQGGGQPPSSAGEPAWARALKAKQALGHGAGLAVHAAGSGDHHGGGAAFNLSED
jgi:type IV secretion system protein TrbL